MLRQRLQVPVLRVVAVMQLLMLPIAFMPESWYGAWHHWLGLGEMPSDAVFRYVIRGAACSQAGIGALLWVMANDVERYKPLIVFSGFIYLLGGPAFLILDHTAGMPWFWCMFDTFCCLGIGAVMLWCFCDRAPVAGVKPTTA